MDTKENKKIKEIVEKFDRPHVRVCSMVLLWIAVIITNYTIDNRFFFLQDFVNDNCNTFKPMLYNISSGTPIFDINVSELPRMENGK